VRSYGFRELCPETERVADSKGSADSTDVCSTTGQTLAYALSSFELRMAPFAFGLPRSKGILKQLRALEFVPFYDFGKVWDVNNGFALAGGGADRQSNGQGVAWGLGLRYPLLGIFNFRLDFAYGKPNGKGMRPDAFIVDLAQAF
jgi:hypothetical protein